MITERDKKVIQMIVNVFETGTPTGDYGNVTSLVGDAGGLTYGRSQTTLNSGNLWKMLAIYLDRREAEHHAIYSPLAALLSAYEHAFNIKDQSLNHDKTLAAVLNKLGQDPLMRITQDEFFDIAYWNPAHKKAKELVLQYPLSHAVVYDSYIHGSFGLVRKMFNERPPANGGEERAWTNAYVFARKRWLASKGKPLCDTIYRMDTFITLISTSNWELQTPFLAHDVLIHEPV